MGFDVAKTLLRSATIVRIPGYHGVSDLSFRNKAISIDFTVHDVEEAKTLLAQTRRFQFQIIHIQLQTSELSHDRT